MPSHYGHYSSSQSFRARRYLHSRTYTTSSSSESQLIPLLGKYQNGESRTASSLEEPSADHKLHHSRPVITASNRGHKDPATLPTSRPTVLSMRGLYSVPINEPRKKISSRFKSEKEQELTELLGQIHDKATFPRNKPGEAYKIVRPSNRIFSHVPRPYIQQTPIAACSIARHISRARPN
jgi:hypothetical protein